MVRLAYVLCRVPVIRFRKGGVGSPAQTIAASPAAPGSSAPSQGAQNAQAPMSTSAISDIDLPLRYRRKPLSQEEIDHINGGGIV